jgi:Ser/Thr protein kinase RdoA (MazF antagonist)
MNHSLKEISGKFRIGSPFDSAIPFGNGHIHDTYLVTTSDKTGDRYILQRLNNKIFKNIPQLQSNIERVTDHIRSKLSGNQNSDIRRECLSLVYSLEGRSWITDEEQNYWRMYYFIPGHRSIDIVKSPDEAFEGGKAIGRFQIMLSDLDGEPLFETIQWFHNIEKRLESFLFKVKTDPAGRVRLVEKEIKFIIERAGEMKVILRLGRERKIPLRITHNDTKFNNILFDKNGKALCIIDLDTVMPGYVHYDFGDAIRTSANMASEDEEDLSKVSMNFELFRAFSEGYLSETSDTLNSIEKNYLAFAPQLVTYTQAVRFLTDYLDGDNYFKILHENHNLQRARAQFRLIESMEQQYSAMKKIIAKLS